MGDLDATLACFSPKIEFQVAGMTPVLTGKDALRDYYSIHWQSISGREARRRACFMNNLEIITTAEIEVLIPERGPGLYVIPMAQRFVFEDTGLILSLTDYLNFDSAVRIDFM